MGDLKSATTQELIQDIVTGDSKRIVEAAREAASRGTELRVVAISRPVLRTRIEVAWRSDAPLAPAARALIGLARAVLGGERLHGRSRSGPPGGP